MSWPHRILPVACAVALCLILMPAHRALADDGLDERGGVVPPDTRGPFAVSVGVGGSGGLGGWTDRSFSSSTDSTEVRHSILGGFVADVRLEWTAQPGFIPYFRLGFGGGAFSYEQPQFGPTDGFAAGTAAVKESRYGHADIGLGVKLTHDLAPTFRLGVAVGMLIVVPFTEVLTFRDNANSEQQWDVHYAPGIGASTTLSAELDLSASVSLRLDVTLDFVHTRWTRLERHTGSGNYSPSGSSTFSGEVDYQTGDFDDEDPASDGFSIRRHAQSDGGVNGFIGAWGITLAVVIHFG